MNVILGLIILIILVVIRGFLLSVSSIFNCVLVESNSKIINFKQVTKQLPSAQLKPIF